jgi:hypothetical protein
MPLPLLIAIFTPLCPLILLYLIARALWRVGTATVREADRTLVLVSPEEFQALIEERK